MQYLRVRGIPRLEETEPLPPVEEGIRALLDDLAELASDAATGRRASPPDRARYLASVLALVEQARNETALEVEDELSRLIGWTCACRCRPHGKIACPRCLHVEGCPVHLDPPTDPELLLDPEALAEALHRTAQELAEDLGALGIEPWSLVPAPTREILTEAVRRVVCSRVQHDPESKE